MRACVSSVCARQRWDQGIGMSNTPVNTGANRSGFGSLPKWRPWVHAHTPVNTPVARGGSGYRPLATLQDHACMCVHTSVLLSSALSKVYACEGICPQIGQAPLGSTQRKLVAKGAVRQPCSAAVKCAISSSCDARDVVPQRLQLLSPGFGQQ